MNEQDDAAARLAAELRVAHETTAAKRQADVDKAIDEGGSAAEVANKLKARDDHASKGRYEHGKRGFNR